MAGDTRVLPQISRPGVNPYIAKAIAPHTEGGDIRLDVVTYTVQSGDHLFPIAEKFKITPETILWTNHAVLEDNPELLIPG